MINFDIQNQNFDKQGLIGVMPAIVTNIDDEEGKGRIKVKILNFGTSDEETDWIRVVMPMASKEYGMQFLPEVGDEVLLAFCGGKMDQPYVLGSLYNDNNKMPSPKEKDKPNDIRMIKTRSGHSIIFGDKQDEESIEIKSAKEMTIKIDDKENSINISDKDGKNLMTISGKDGTISIKADKKLELAASSSKIVIDEQSIQIQSGNNLEVKGKQISIQGDATVEVKANSKLDINSSGVSTFKGSMVQIN